jgi:hypothetical protein
MTDPQIDIEDEDDAWFAEATGEFFDGVLDEDES